MSHSEISNWAEEVIQWAIDEFDEEIAKCFEGKVNTFVFKAVHLHLSTKLII